MMGFALLNPSYSRIILSASATALRAAKRGEIKDAAILTKLITRCNGPSWKQVGET
jgi:hypothetical protein